LQQQQQQQQQQRVTGNGILSYDIKGGLEERRPTVVSAARVAKLGTLQC